MSLRIELDELEEKFREKAMKKYGYSKGALKKAAVEALQRWVSEQEEIPRVKDPFPLIEGMLKHLKGKVTAVDLQHEAAKLWVK